MNFIDPARVLVFLRKRKKGALLFKRNACKGTAEKSKLSRFEIHFFQCAEVLFNRAPCAADRNITVPCGNTLLIAENAVIRAAAMRNEHRNNRVLFHSGESLLVKITSIIHENPKRGKRRRESAFFAFSGISCGIK